MSLPLREGNTKTTDFGFQAGDMAHCPDRNASKLVCAAASFRKFACITICRALLAALLGCLSSGSVRGLHRGDDAVGQQGKLACGASCWVSGCEHGHTQHSS